MGTLTIELQHLIQGLWQKPAHQQPKGSKFGLAHSVWLQPKKPQSLFTDEHSIVSSPHATFGSISARGTAPLYSQVNKSMCRLDTNVWILRKCF